MHVLSYIIDKYFNFINNTVTLHKLNSVLTNITKHKNKKKYYLKIKVEINILFVCL